MKNDLDSDFQINFLLISTPRTRIRKQKSKPKQIPAKNIRIFVVEFDENSFSYKMSSKISISLENPIVSKESTEDFPHYLQFLPAKIHSNDKANVKPYFNDYILEKDDGELSCVLRGRPLNGRKVDLEDQKAVVLKVPNAPNQIKSDLLIENDDEEMSDEANSNNIECRTMSVNEKITVWNYDLPSDQGTDPLTKASMYMNLAKILHSE